MDVARARMALISEAAVMTKPLSCGTPPTLRPPRPTTISRSSRQFMSIAFFHTTRVGSMLSSFRLVRWFSTIAERRLWAEADRVNVPGEMEVDVPHRVDLGATAPGGAALEAEHRPHGRLPQRPDDLDPELS